MVKDAEAVRLNSNYKESMRKLTDKYWQLAECEPDWNQAQNYRKIAKALEAIINDEADSEASGPRDSSSESS